MVEKRRDSNDLIEPMLAAKGAYLVSMWRALMVGSVANRAMYGNNGLHLSDDGVKRITQYLINCLGRAPPRGY